MEPLGLGIMALLVLVGLAALVAAVRQPRAARRTAAGGAEADGPPRTLGLVTRGVIVGLLLAAAWVEIYGLRVSLAAYGDNPPPLADRLVIVGVLVFFGLASFLLYLATRAGIRRAALRARAGALETSRPTPPPAAHAPGSNGRSAPGPLPVRVAPLGDGARQPVPATTRAALSPARRLEVVLAILRGETTAEAVARAEGLDRAEVEGWYRRCLAASLRALSGEVATDEHLPPAPIGPDATAARSAGARDEELARLHAKIGELVMRLEAAEAARER
jgi:hypothetical protein